MLKDGDWFLRISKPIKLVETSQKDNANRIYFEHLDSYFKMGNGHTPSRATIEDNE